MPRALLQLALTVALVLLGWGGLVWLRETQAPPPQAPDRTPVRVAVRLQTVEPERFFRLIRGEAVLVEARRAQLAAEIGGRIVDLHPDWRPGSAVAAGELLWAVDNVQLMAEVLHQEASLALVGVDRASADNGVAAARDASQLAQETLRSAEREVERWETLARSDPGEQSRLDQVRVARLSAASQVTQADFAEQAAELARRGAEAREAQVRAALTSARAQLSKAQVHAPFDGLLESSAPALGTILVPGAPVTGLLQVAPLRISLPVHEERLAWLALGSLATVRVPALQIDGKVAELAGQVTALGARADPQTRSIAVEIEVSVVPGEAGLGALRPGLSAKVELAGAPLESAIVLDEGWLVRHAGGPAVLVPVETPDGWVARARKVTTAERLDGRVVVRAGLTAGERLIVAPLAGLSDGARIELAAEANR